AFGVRLGAALLVALEGAEVSVGERREGVEGRSGAAGHGGRFWAIRGRDATAEGPPSLYGRAGVSYPRPRFLPDPRRTTWRSAGRSGSTAGSCRGTTRSSTSSPTPSTTGSESSRGSGATASRTADRRSSGSGTTCGGCSTRHGCA